MIDSSDLDDLARALSRIRFGGPVHTVYNPLVYARQPFAAYLEKYAPPRGKTLLLGMNPGPWGMVQTGVPFGEVEMVRDWLRMEAPVGEPKKKHPKRPVQGFACARREVSGRRLWGWARDRYGTPEAFFRVFFVWNYCPLAFFDAEGRNLTPDRLAATDRRKLFRVLDESLRKTVEGLAVSGVVGIGRFAADRADAALSGSGIPVGRVTHPSPANPKANRGWAPLAESELREFGIAF